MPYIHTVSYNEADEELKSVYNQIIKSRGKLAEVHKIQSLNPGALVAHMELYMNIMYRQSPLKRYQREMMAVVVSAANNCPYCINHHEQALLAYWKDKSRTESLLNDRKKAGLSHKDELLCALAEKLTKYPESGFSDNVYSLRDEGFDDRSVLDAVQVIAYFNFVNRLVLGLGVDYNQKEITGYNY